MCHGCVMTVWCVHDRIMSPLCRYLQVKCYRLLSSLISSCHNTNMSNNANFSLTVSQFTEWHLITVINIHKDLYMFMTGVMSVLCTPLTNKVVPHVLRVFCRRRFSAELLVSEPVHQRHPVRSAGQGLQSNCQSRGRFTQSSKIWCLDRNVCQGTAVILDVSLEARVKKERNMKSI